MEDGTWARELDRSTYQCWTVPGGIQFTEGPPLPYLAQRAAALAFNPLAWIDWIDAVRVNEFETAAA